MNNNNYCVLVEEDETVDGNCCGDEATKNKQSSSTVKEEFSIDPQPANKPRWIDPSTKQTFKRLRKVLLIVLLLGFILFFFLVNFLIPHRANLLQCTERPAKLVWNQTFKGLDISCEMALSSGRHQGVIIGYKSTHQVKNTGIMMIDGESGSVVWRQSLFTKPVNIKCDNMIDINNDGNDDCLVVGDEGLFAAINVINGRSFWYMHSHNDVVTPASIMMPLVTAFDFNDDTIPEMLTLVKTTNGQGHLMFISGRTGIIIGDLLPFPSWCHLLSTTLIIVNENDENQHLVISCVSNNTGEVWTANVRHLYETVLKSNNETIHAPLFFNVFICGEPTSAVSIFGTHTNGLAVVICNSGEMASVDVPNRTVRWRRSLPYFTHRRVLGGDPAVKNGEILTIWSGDNASVMMSLSVENGRTLWTWTGNSNSSVSMAKTYMSLDELVIIMKVIKCLGIRDKSPIIECECIETYLDYRPHTDSISEIQAISKSFYASHSCVIADEKSLSSVVVGQISRNHNEQEIVVVESSQPNTSEINVTDFNFNMIVKKIKLKSSECVLGSKTRII